jgi:hypothetical protein
LVFASTGGSILANPVRSYQVTVLSMPSGVTRTEAYGVSNGSIVGYGVDPNKGCYPMLWRSPTNPVALSGPNGECAAIGCAFNTQAGYMPSASGESFRAVLWHGTASSMVDLSPSGSLNSGVWAISETGKYQVGVSRAYFGAVETGHAMIWRGSAASVIDLHPPGVTDSEAAAVTEGSGSIPMTVVGTTYTESQGYESTHAVLWQPQQNVFVDLNPPGVTGSSALAVSGPYQGGSWFMPWGDEGAALWQGSASSFVDLTPSEWAGAEINAIARVGWSYLEVGEVHSYDQTTEHAMVWQGTAGSAEDLQQFLPEGYPNSVASGIDAQGRIVGTMWGRNGPVAVMWSPIGSIP